MDVGDASGQGGRAFALPFGAPPPAPCIRQTLHPRTAGDRHGFPVLLDLAAL
jgi:hypothetical protein